MLLRYRLFYYFVVLIFVWGLIISIITNEIIVGLLLSLPGIWLVFGITIAKWVVKPDTIEFWAGHRYLKLNYSQIIDIKSFQSKVGVFPDFAIYSENAVQLDYYNKKDEKIEFRFSIASKEREEFITIIKNHSKNSNRDKELK